MGWTYNTPEGVANDGLYISAVALILTAVSLVLLLLRLHVRGRMLKSIGAGKYIGVPQAS